MTKIICLRTAPYNYQLPGHDLYRSYDSVAQLQVDPGIAAISMPTDLKQLAKKATVISSPARRARQTARLLGSEYVINEELREIRYEMKQLISPADFASQAPSQATTAARQLFFPKLFAGQLSETNQQLQTRLLRVLRLLADQEMTTVVISHGFFLKYLELAVLYPSCLESIEIFRRHYDGSQIGFGFLQGPHFNTEQIKAALEQLQRSKSFEADRSEV